MRRVSRVMPLAVVLALAGSAVPSGPASGGGPTVVIDNHAFQTPSLGVTIGATVTFANDDSTTHTATSNNGFFDTGGISPSGEDAVEFPYAGGFGYHCTPHPSMTGKVKVRMTKAGSAGAGWTIRWSSLSSTPGNRTFDVQVDRPGTSGFESFRTNTSSRSATFNPSRTGTYKFRSRTDNTDSGESSGFSPVLSLVIS